MRFRRGKSSNKAQKGSAAPWQNGERKVIDGGGAGSNSRQVVPDTGFGDIDGGSSREETFFEASPWLESDCDDDFYSVNEGNDEPFGHRYDFVPNISEVSFNQQWHLVPASSDLTPARSFSSQTSGRIASYAVASKNLPTLGAILKAEPLKPPAPHMRKLGDLLREPQDDDGGLSRADSLRLAEEANRCCVPQLARAISCNGTRRSKG